LPCDIKQYFPSIDHAILREILARKLDDPDVLWLIDKILESGRGVLSEEYEMVYFADDDLFAPLRPRGLPIGNLTSQFWANCYLAAFDQFVKRELGCRGYVRYVDDFLLFAGDKRTLSTWRREIVTRLAQFRLTIHEQAAAARPCSEGLPFLGFVLFPSHRRLKRRKGIAFRRRLRAAVSAGAAEEMTLDSLNALIRGWVNHVRHADTWGLRRAMLPSCRALGSKRIAQGGQDETRYRRI
jgi:hypothetical protein